MRRHSKCRVSVAFVFLALLAGCSVKPMTITKIKVERITLPNALLTAPPLPPVPINARTQQDAQHYVVQLWNYARDRKSQLYAIKKLNDAWAKQTKK